MLAMRKAGAGHWLQVLTQAAAKVDEKKTAAAEEEGTMTTEATTEICAVR